MRAVTWWGREEVGVTEVADPTIEEPTDALVRITSTGICGSDLHLYDVLTMFMSPGDVLGHEGMGVVEATGPEVTHVVPGDRVIVPFNISCGDCFMCRRGLYAQCETTQVREHGKGARLYGYSKLYGSVPGAQAEYLRVPQAHFGLVPVPGGPEDDDRYLYLTDVLPTAMQAVDYAAIPEGGTLAVYGLGPVGQMCCRIARLLTGATVYGVDFEPARLELARRWGVEVLDRNHTDPVEAIVEATSGRGADSVIDAVGLEARGSPLAEAAQKMATLLPRLLAAPLVERAGIDRLQALYDSIRTVRRGGTISVIGVYGGSLDPIPMLELFDKGVQIRMGQAHVKRWIADLLPHVLDDADPLGTRDLATHHLPLQDAPAAYRMLQRKEEDVVKVVLRP